MRPSIGFAIGLISSFAAAPASPEDCREIYRSEHSRGFNCASGALREAGEGWLLPAVPPMVDLRFDRAQVLRTLSVSGRCSMVGVAAADRVSVSTDDGLTVQTALLDQERRQNIVLPRWTRTQSVRIEVLSLHGEGRPCIGEVSADLDEARRDGFHGGVCEMQSDESSVKACLEERADWVEGRVNETAALVAAHRRAQDGTARPPASRGNAEAFRRAQRAWTAWRDAECDSRFRLAAPGSGASAIYLGCRVELGEARWVWLLGETD